MAELTFPITGVYVAIIMPLELIIIAVAAEFSLYFFMKYLTNRKKSLPSVVEFDWGVLFLLFTGAMSFFIISDFYYVNRDIFTPLGYFSILFGGLILVLHLEINRIMYTKYIFTGFTCAVIGILLTLLLIGSPLYRTVAYISVVPAMAMVFVYFIRIARKIWTKYKLYSIGLIFGVFLWFLGYMGASSIAVTIFGGLHIRVIGDLAILGGMIFMGFFLNWIPSLAEIGWQDKIKSIIFTTQTGLLLYSESFQEGLPKDEAMIAGAISMLDTFIEETITTRTTIKTFTKEDDVLVIVKGEQVLGILVVQQELEILKYFLRESVKKFEEFHVNTLKNWTGNLDLFKWTHYLIHDILEIKRI